MRIAFATLGCRINQSETDAMRQAAAAAGNAIVPFEGEADVYVVNTCSVTAKSDYQCRQTIRAAVRRAGGARIVVTGCYAETRPDDVRGIAGVTMVLGNGEKGELLKHLEAGGLSGHSGDAVATGSVQPRTRRILKIQDGCDSRCTYCVVPLARGSSRSVPRTEVAVQFDQASREGCPEVVLSGIHIGRYGTDLVPQSDLTGLLQELLPSRRKVRLRLSSIEPNEVTEGILSMLGQGLCRHLHIPLQSGDDAILRSMNRNYTASAYSTIVRKIDFRIPDMAIGADVMVGFPGEGEKEFQNTYDLIESLPLSHLHVFSYSPRPGTAAAEMKWPVPSDQKSKRNERLRALAFEKNVRFREKMTGKILPVVLEESHAGDEESASGLTDNYIRIRVQGAGKDHFGREINVLVTGLDGKGLKGEIDITS